MPRLALFNIDQTPVSIGSGNRPQRHARNVAFERGHGIPNAFPEIGFPWGMDLPLLVEVYQKWGLISGSPEALPNLSEMPYRIIT